MAFSRQECWHGLPFPTPGIFLTQGSNLHLLHLLHWQEDSLRLRHLGSPYYVSLFNYLSCLKPSCLPTAQRVRLKQSGGYIRCSLSLARILPLPVVLPQLEFKANALNHSWPIYGISPINVIFFYLSIVDLQCIVSFRHIAKWLLCVGVGVCVCIVATEQLSTHVKAAQLHPTLCNPTDSSSPSSSVHGLLSPGQNAGVASHSLLQGIFPTQGSNQVSCIVGRFFTIRATKEVQEYWSG